MYSTILEHYDELFPLDIKALDFAVSGAPNAQSYLDIGCATGILGEAIKDKGHKVVGVDFDKAVIEKAQCRRCIMLEFKAVSPSMLDFDMADHSFNQVLCFNNTIARLPNEMAIQNLVKKTKDLLKDNGLFKGQLYNYDWLLSEGIGELPVIETDAVTFRRQHRLEQQFLECYTVLSRKDNETNVSACLPLFPIKRNQIEAILREAGFKKITFYDDFDRTPFTGSSDILVFEAR